MQIHQQPQCICTRHPSPQEGNSLAYQYCEFGGYTGHHPVRLRRRVQTRCNRPSVSVLDISPPQERNGLAYQYCEFGGYTGHRPVRLRLPPLHRRGIVWPTSTGYFTPSLRRRVQT